MEPSDYCDVNFPVDRSQKNTMLFSRILSSPLAELVGGVCVAGVIFLILFTEPVGL